MACQVHTWGLNGLVVAFLDLAIAYLFLCVSAVAFFASKFLGFFGLNLPCPCKTIPGNDNCFNRLLVDFLAQQVANVQLSVKEKFPFNDSIWARNHSNHIGADYCANGILEIEGDASCSSVSDVRQSRNVVGRDFGRWDKEYDVKGKGVISYMPRSRLHRRSRKGGVDHGKYSAVSSYGPSLHEEILGGTPHSHSSSNKGGDGITRGISLPADYGGAYHIEYKKAPSVVGRMKSNLSSVQMNNSSDDDMEIKQNVLSIEELQEAKSFCGLEGNTIQLLEQALEKERAARDALYIELEKERNAAASAAEEAMAMILRLQEDKASIEMEARQHQRIFEEKSAYEAEEMDILKEILVRREVEKHLLEMEVEGYRQMVSPGNQQLVDDGTSGAPTKLLGLLIDPNDDPGLLLRQLSASTDKKLMTANRCSSGAANESPIQYKNEKYISEKQENQGGKLRQMSGSADAAVNMDLQEKEIISSEGSLCSTPNCSQESNFLEKSIPIERKELEQNEEMNLVPRADEKNPKIVNGTGTSDLHYMQCLKPQEDEARHELNNTGDLMLEKDSHVYDVHVVGDGSSICSDENKSKSEKLSVGGWLKVDDKNSISFETPVTKCVNIVTDCPSTSGMHTEVNIKRSNSEGYHGLPPVIPKVTSKLSDLRRSSMSMVDSGMLNIDNEVGQLLARLRIVKEGREKLSFNLENSERENLHLKHLEDTASQVQQIRSKTEPGKATLSKKKRCKSVSSGLLRSS